MWLYFRMCKNEEEKEYAPSMVIQKAKGNISENSVRAGFQELKKNGYLVRRIDIHALSLVEYFNEKGLTTCMSCEGLQNHTKQFFRYNSQMTLMKSKS